MNPAYSTAQGLATVPQECSAALVLRHAERESFPGGSLGRDVRLTQRGERSAETLGGRLAQRPFGLVVSSPLPRCADTAAAIRRGARREGPVDFDWRLGEPGPFVVGAAAAEQLFLSLSVREVVRRQLVDEKPPHGMRPTTQGVALLLDLVVENLGCDGRLNIYVTHDSILAALVGRLLGLPVYESGWPDYLDGLYVWRGPTGLQFTWQATLMELGEAPYPIGG